MKHGFYPRLAWNGITKNRRIYLPYLLTCVGMIMMFYIVSFLATSQTVAAMPGGDTMQTMLSMGCGVIGVFSLLFLFYTNSFLLRRRKKEFGMYNILGMGKWNVVRILTWESIIISVVSLCIGLFSGILFSKIAELCMAHMLAGEISFSFSVAWKTVLQTIFLFLGIFLLILLNALRQIHVSKPVELLRSDSLGEKPPKAKCFLAFLGVVILGGAYYLAVSIEDPLSALLWFFVAVVMVILATYLLFITGSVALCRLLQKNKRYYYKTNHFVSVASMSYRMKRNGAGLASICILSTMVLVMLSSTTCLYIGAEDSLRNRYPRNIVVDTYSIEARYTDAVHAAVDSALAEHNAEPENILHYRYLDVAGYFDGDHVLFDQNSLQSFQITQYDNVRQMFIVPLEDYTRLMGENETLAQDEVLLYSTKSEYRYDTITIEGCDTMRVKRIVSEFVDNGVDAMQVIPSLFIFVPDLQTMENIFDKQAEIYNDNRSYKHDYYGFDLDCSDETQIAVAQSISDSIRQLQINDSGFPETSSDSVARERSGFYALYGGLFFLGILLGIVFIIAAVLIMYYKQVSEGYEDRNRFEIMQKVGMTKKEIRKSVNSQVLTVFFLPLLTAGIHMAFAFPLIAKLLALFGLMDIWLLIGVTGCCFLIFALFYVCVYRITSRTYYNIVSGRGGA